MKNINTPEALVVDYENNLIECPYCSGKIPKWEFLKRVKRLCHFCLDKRFVDLITQEGEICAQIPLGKSGKNALVSIDDYLYLMTWKWQYIKSGYANRVTNKGRGNWINVLMHRVITDCPEGMTVDHINGNKLDNRRSNLRVCTITQNHNNKNITKRNKSGYKGVCWDKRKNKWLAYITINGKLTWLGHHDNVMEAAFSYNQAAKKNFGEFAKINILPAVYQP